MCTETDICGIHIAQLGNPLAALNVAEDEGEREPNISLHHTQEDRTFMFRLNILF